MASGFKRRPSATELDAIASVINVPDPVVPTREISNPTQSNKAGNAVTLNAASRSVLESYKNVPIGTVIEAPIDHFKKNPLNARRVVAPLKLDQLSSQMAARGQDVSVLAYVDKAGDLCLIDGHRRLAAAPAGGLSTLRVEIRPEPEGKKALYLASRQANKDREEQTPLDDALAWKMLLETGVYASQAELALDMDESEAVVSRTLGLAEFPKTLINQLGERPALLNLRMLDALKRYHTAADDDATEAFILVVVKDGLSSRDVDDARKSLSKVPVARARSAVQALNFAKGKSVIKRFTGQGRLVIEIQDAQESDIEAIQAVIQKILGQHLGQLQ